MSEPVSYLMGQDLSSLRFCTFISLKLQPGNSKPSFWAESLNVAVCEPEMDSETYRILRVFFKKKIQLFFLPQYYKKHLTKEHIALSSPKGQLQIRRLESS